MAVRHTGLVSQQSDLRQVPVDPHPRLPVWLPDVILGLIVVALAFAPSPVKEFTASSPVALVFVLLPIAILPWRRRWPLAVVIALLVDFAAAALAGTLSPGIAVALAAAVFHVAARGSRRRGFTVGACATAAIVLLAFLGSVGSIVDPRILQFGLIVALGTAAGDGARSRRAYIAAIQERAERAERTREAEASRRVSEERLRIARDLHDAVAHQIAVISLNAGVASSAVDTRPDKAKESLATIRAAARTVLAEIGDLMTMLRADGAADSTSRPQGGLDHLEELVHQFTASGLEVHTRIEGDPTRVSGAVSHVAYRVIQEALTNAHKHGTERRAHVLVHVGEHEVVVTVSNPMDTGTARERDAAGSGLGLVGLRERVASVRGTVSAGPATAGWKVEARLPLSREDTH